MKKLKSAKMLVKRVQYQEVVVSEENGFIMPETVKQLVSLANDMNNNSNAYTALGHWDNCEVTIESLEFDEDES